RHRPPIVGTSCSGFCSDHRCSLRDHRGFCRCRKATTRCLDVVSRQRKRAGRARSSCLVTGSLRPYLVRAPRVAVLRGIERRAAPLEKSRLPNLGDYTAWCGHRARFIQVSRRCGRSRRRLDLTQLRVLQRHQCLSLSGWPRKIFPAHIAVFGEAPFRNYTVFQRSDTLVNGGGLEHQSSQVDEVTTSQLDAGYIPGLYSHEAFHAWNVKRLRPADMVPYRYDDAQPTTWLWVSEGVTDYYGALALVRSGINADSAFYNFIA